MAANSRCVTVIVGVNGVFGERMCEVARRAGAEIIRVEEQWGRAIDPQRLLDARAAAPHARLVAVVHAETSTGVENDVAPLAALRAIKTTMLDGQREQVAAARRREDRAFAITFGFDPAVLEA